jgi:hypothetical protein
VIECGLPEVPSDAVVQVASYAESPALKATDTLLQPEIVEPPDLKVTLPPTATVGVPEDGATVAVKVIV